MVLIKLLDWAALLFNVDKYTLMHISKQSKFLIYIDRLFLPGLSQEKEQLSLKKQEKYLDLLELGEKKSENTEMILY